MSHGRILVVPIPIQFQSNPNGWVEGGKTKSGGSHVNSFLSLVPLLAFAVAAV